MTVAQICGRIITRLDDDPAAPVSVQVGSGPTVDGVVVADEVLAAINEGQEFAAMLTLCFEKTASFDLGTTWFRPREILTDFLVPLRITVGGLRLRPATLAELDASNEFWQLTSGTTQRYVTNGCNLLAVTPQSDVTAQFTYAYSPAELGPSATPDLPEGYHQDLVEYGVYRCKLKEGAQQLARGLGNLNTFLDAMTRLGNVVRARSLAARYDVMPFELQLFDRSKLIDEILKWQAKGRK